MNIRKIIKEEIDDLEWARELVNIPVIPKPDGNRYLLRFKTGTPKGTFDMVLSTMKNLGWSVDVDEVDHIVERLTKYSNYSNYTYIHLQPGYRRYSIGNSPSIFEDVNRVSYDSVPHIWITR